MSEVSANGVLVVDDDPSIRGLLLWRLKKEGFEARQAEDGIDGLVKLRDHLPQVIISDLVMPRMAGIEFISIVRRRFPFMPVIVFSGSSPHEIPAESKPDHWFDKNCQHVTELLRAVHDLVRKTPDRPYLPQVISIPVRARPGGAGYFVLTCTDCLRVFHVASMPENNTVERTAACVHCEALVPYLIESAEPV